MTTYEIRQNAMGYWDRTVVHDSGNREHWNPVVLSEAEEWQRTRIAADFIRERFDPETAYQLTRGLVVI